MVAAAAIVGASTLAGGALAANAASNAADTEAGAANNATKTQTQLAQEALDLSSQYNAPYRNAGNAALSQLSSMLGISYSQPQNTTSSNFDAQAYLSANPDVAKVAADPGQNMGMTPEQFAYWHYQNYGQGEGRTFTSQDGSTGGATAQGAGSPSGATAFDISKTPGYQFQLQQGLQGVKNTGAAGSGVLNSATLTGLNNYAQGQAQSYYGNYLSQLAGIAGLGQSSANNTATNGGNILTGLGSQVGSNIIGAGNAQAAGQIGSANAISSGLTNAGSYYGLSKLLGNSGTTPSPFASTADPLGDGLKAGQFGGLSPGDG